MSWIGALAAGARLLGLRSAIGGVWTWLTANAAHLLLGLLALVGAWGWYGHHEAAKWHRVADSTEARRQADNKLWAWADRINHKSIADLIAALDGQSAMVRRWAADATARQQAAQAALQAATARGAAAEALAQRIDAERAQRAPGGPGCASGQAVLDAKGEL